MISDISYFLERQKCLDIKRNNLRRLNYNLSLLRLIFFLALASILIWGFVGTFGIFHYIAGAVFLASFIYACIIHERKKEEENFSEILCGINKKYIARINGDFDSLKPDGEEFEVEDHDYSIDLDILGRHSLFSLYNISETYWGRRDFAGRLLRTSDDSDTDEILIRQKTISQFIENPDFLQEYQAEAAIGNIASYPKAIMEFASDNTVFPHYLTNIRRFLPLLWLIPVVVLFLNSKYALIAVFGIIILNLIFHFFFASKYASYFKNSRGMSRQIKTIVNLFKLLESSDLDDPYLLSLIRAGVKEDENTRASSCLEELDHICNLCSLREQPLFAFLINAVYPFDLLCEEKLLSWTNRYHEEFMTDIESLGIIEGLMCAANVGIVSKYSVFPTFLECESDDCSNAFFDADELYHPLIRPEEVVSNSVTLDGSITLITGSNMSGKTTLIRTVGICCVLAYMGAPVPADSCKLGVMRIMSSMRIVDSLEEQMSTFRCELNRISRIVHASNENKPMIFLIDEIFRGTNSKDRTDGALAVLKKLDRKHIMGLMTTHDYALCDMASSHLEHISYYHFSEEYKDDGIIFDYKLKEGVSNESNAIFLMKLVGIVD